ncbi:hypothetical protein FRACYDRAFT_256832 [Fragilariopsis cylindrus CCMP1102]|uniref:Uncharacterized protein n=1 Tax=Fragilariopsis cylindrus CCMP1102 TaxID=635003 RepID=A0A1E7EJF4_9STRA|nr:hypothetical protein FRACYDRAFT_256832 [Fragilariopsis cylindrus CCMP1102]|eukprot:OEU06029.1 hypothetical protein FRACYDRAFT_256832 [Fragilariopsis cylindrus CCMP1102]
MLSAAERQRQEQLNNNINRQHHRLLKELDILPPRPVLFPCFSSFNINNYTACCGANWSTTRSSSSMGDNRSNGKSYFDLYPTTLVTVKAKDSYSSITSTLPNNIDKKLTPSSPSTPMTLPLSPCDTVESLTVTTTEEEDDNDDGNSNNIITLITRNPVTSSATPINTAINMSDNNNLRHDENENNKTDDDYFDCAMMNIPDMTPNNDGSTTTAAAAATGIDLSRFSSSSRSKRASSSPPTSTSKSYIAKKDNNNINRYRLLFLQTIAVEVFRILFSAVMVDNSKKRTGKHKQKEDKQNNSQEANYNYTEM